MVMSELRDILKEEYRKKEEAAFNPQVLMSLIEEVMDSMPVLLEKAKQPSTLTIDLIPTLPISEIGWGSLSTPEEGGKAQRTAPGQELAQYLSNIAPGEDIKGKIAALNEYFDNPLPQEVSNPAAQIKNTISNLVFYKTLTNIITNFNASAAGFAFESFLAVLLDAESGKQIPASAASTIADIVLFEGGRPISLKLYREGQLKVGGSYKQLVEDLTGRYPVMEYIVVTKDLKGEGLKQEGQLNFHGFNFTRENFLQILTLKPKEAELLSIPAIFWEPIPDLEAKLKEAQTLKQFLTLPGRTEVNLVPIINAFVENVTSKMAEAGFEEEAIKEFQVEFERLVDPESGVYVGTEAKPIRFAYTTPRGLRGLLKQINLPSGEGATMLRDIYLAAHAEAVNRRKKLGGRGSARKEKFKELDYRAGRKSYKRLLEIQQEGSPELFEVALKSTSGYVRNRQFELAKGDLGKMSTLPNQENLFPYDEFEVGTIRIGAAKIQDMLDASINAFNESIFSIFSDLKDLSINLNAYVAGGLEDDSLADEAKEDAENIATGTEKIRDPKQGQQTQLPFKKE
tara:strand:- start:50 stop:1756 length:1707 start_codon:yes stop_codon:yes gene_type:complete